MIKSLALILNLVFAEAAPVSLQEREVDQDSTLILFVRAY
jgi:hypothetical protein